MIRLYVHIAYSGKTEIVFGHDIGEEGVSIEFSVYRKYRPRDALKKLEEMLSKTELTWINPGKPEWKVDFDTAKSTLNGLNELDWLRGTAYVIPEIEDEKSEVFGEERTETVVRLIFYKEDIHLQQSRKIFLCHRGKNKPLIREFNQTLKAIGLDTWLDEEAMPAGAVLERDLLQGMKDSCAAVFFITPDFKDEGYLATEIDYAISQKRSKKERFQIITMVLSDKHGKKGVVPDLLKRYVWKEPKSDLECLREIIKALPLDVGIRGWKQ